MLLLIYRPYAWNVYKGESSDSPFFLCDLLIH
jgi:hypothetical protein